MEGATDPKMLENRAFFKLGLIIHDHRKAMMAFGLVSCILMGGLMAIGPDWAEGFGEDDVESVNAGRLISERFATDTEESGPSFRYVVFHPTLNDTSEEWQQAVRDALSDIANHPNANVEYSWEKDEVDRDDVVVTDESGTYAINKIVFNTNRKEAKTLLTDLEETVDLDSAFDGWMTDGIFLDWTFDDRIKKDLIKAEVVAIPLTLLILGLIFGSLIAAILPMGVGGGTLVAAVGMTIWLSNITDVTVYATNIVSLIGIGVSIDYSLFLVNRFREELDRGHDTRTATDMSCATAGKAVFYSGPSRERCSRRGTGADPAGARRAFPATPRSPRRRTWPLFGGTRCC